VVVNEPELSCTRRIPRSLVALVQIAAAVTATLTVAFAVITLWGAFISPHFLPDDGAEVSPALASSLTQVNSSSYSAP